MRYIKHYYLFAILYYLIPGFRQWAMDAQIKRGLLEVCVLASIRYRDSYGYQIIKQMKPYVEISESTLYPILRRLENMKLLTVRSEEYNGRLRKYYRITDSGQQRLAAFSEEWKEIASIYQYVTREDDSHDET